MEKIDPRLPAKVKKDYQQRLGDTTYLSDLHSAIFQVIPGILDDTEKQASLRAFTAQPNTNLNAFNCPSTHPQPLHSHPEPLH